MPLVNRLQLESPAEKKAALRRYRELLRSNADDAKSVDELKRLLVCLDKTAAAAQRDQDVIQQIAKHRKTIAAAREYQPKIAPAEEAIHAHHKETQAILAQRKAQADQLSADLGGILKVYNAGTEAMAEINQLKGGEFGELLDDEPAVTDADLKP